MNEVVHSKRRCGVCYRDLATKHGIRTHVAFGDGSLRCYAEPDRAHGDYISAFMFTVRPEDDLRRKRDDNG